MVHPDNGILSAKKKWATNSWKDMEELLGETRQSEKATYCMSPSIWYPEKKQATDAVKTSVVSRGWDQGRKREGWTGRAEGMF